MTLNNRITDTERWWDSWIAVFTIGIIVMVAGRLWVTEWTSELYIIVYLAFFAALSGLALGASQFSPLVAFFISTYFGSFGIVWLLASTISNEIPWRDRITDHIWWRLRLSFEQFNSGQGVTDPILFLSIMAVLIWIMSFTAAFIIIRKGSAWPVLIPLGMTMLVISHFDQDLARNTRFLMTFIFFTLMIVGRIHLLHSQNKWGQEGVQITSENMDDLIHALTILVFVSVVLAWMIPLTPQQVERYSGLWDKITEGWDELRQRFGDILVLEATPDMHFDSAFGEVLNLGLGLPSDEKVVFTVDITAAPPVGYRHYWYTRSYDYYKNASWSSAPGLSQKLRFPEDFSRIYPPLAWHQPAGYTFTSQAERLSSLFVTGTPTWISRPVETISQNILFENLEPAEDIVGLIAYPEILNGETYQVETLVSTPTASDLRATSLDYPDWLDRYLQLPVDFSPEIATLAANITNKGDHPYDLTMDITRWLRINIEYARTIPNLPNEIDPMEWFLFDGKTGFCNYYATAEVLMLRSLGVPARFAVGYAQGEFDSNSKSYTVRQEDSHAWPEVYFIGYGWTAFEPTVSQPALIRPVGFDPNAERFHQPERGEVPQFDDDFEMLYPNEIESELDNAVELEDDFIDVSKRFEGISVIWVMLIIFLFLLIGGIIILQHPEWLKIDVEPLPVMIETWLEKHSLPAPRWLKRWVYFVSLSAAEKAYRNLGWSIKIMGQPLNLAQTPNERAQILIKLIPQAYQPALEVVSEYNLDKFSAQDVDIGYAKKAGRKILGLALRARLKNLFSIR